MFNNEDVRKLLNRQVKTIRPYKNLPVGTLGLVQGSVLKKKTLMLVIVFFYQTFTGSNRYTIHVGKREFIECIAVVENGKGLTVDGFSGVW